MLVSGAWLCCIPRHHSPLWQIYFEGSWNEALSLGQFQVSSQGQALQQSGCSRQVHPPLPIALIGNQQRALPFSANHSRQVLGDASLQVWKHVWPNLGSLFYQLLHTELTQHNWLGPVCVDIGPPVSCLLIKLLVCLGVWTSFSKNN